ncbi:hypothetical protein COV19_05980 [Candidatus Woesearchaeota archaeon CG10_big_fil_rev_8_21_14_0_10_44_13]|nr:MAG: hypothetical protein COV19_05980 [Candidatus Woesearchaeota archaeon CG10_big_fil_rev_8_21_14_0_10_44_13]
MNLKAIAILLVALLIANLVLFALKLVNEAFFWSVIVIAAILAYFVLPRLRKSMANKEKHKK